MHGFVNIHLYYFVLVFLVCMCVCLYVHMCMGVCFTCMCTHVEDETTFFFGRFPCYSLRQGLSMEPKAHQYGKLASHAVALGLLCIYLQIVLELQRSARHTQYLLGFCSHLRSQHSLCLPFSTLCHLRNGEFVPPMCNILFMNRLRPLFAE